MTHTHRVQAFVRQPGTLNGGALHIGHNVKGLAVLQERDGTLLLKGHHVWVCQNVHAGQARMRMIWHNPTQCRKQECCKKDGGLRSVVSSIENVYLSDQSFHGIWNQTSQIFSKTFLLKPKCSFMTERLCKFRTDTKGYFVSGCTTQWRMTLGCQTQAWIQHSYFPPCFKGHTTAAALAKNAGWHAGSSTMELISNNTGVGFPQPQLGSMKGEILWKHTWYVRQGQGALCDCWISTVISIHHPRLRQFRKNLRKMPLFFFTSTKKTILKLWERNSGGLAKADRQGGQANYLMVLGS